ncbi:MAG: hypothetical protein RBR59_07055 [Sulfurimonadaceae bacterium]|nr:hypothetical protein [Sulfurimonadaceae bacterium]
MNKQINAKFYFKTLITIILFFILYHLFIWFSFTSKIFNPKDGMFVGDLARMSYQIDLSSPRRLEYNLSKDHLHKDNYNNQQIDYLTIGDSFSRGGGHGVNPYYQDYFATKLDANVLNIRPSGEYTALETIIGLYNNGYLEKIKPKNIIVESVVRIIPDRYSKEIDFDINNTSFVIEEKIINPENQQNVHVINTANYKLPFYTLMYNFKNNAQKNVYLFDLNKKLFSVGNGTKILILDDDVKNIPKFTHENIIKINNNFNNVAKLLKEININLLFMPAPDKYDLYSKYINDKSYGNNPFFDLIDPLEKDYIFVNTKQILSSLLENGIQDVYHIDDTHWSYKASEAISKDKLFYTIKNGSLCR